MLEFTFNDDKSPVAHLTIMEKEVGLEKRNFLVLWFREAEYVPNPGNYAAYYSNKSYWRILWEKHPSATDPFKWFFVESSIDVYKLTLSKTQKKWSEHYICIRLAAITKENVEKFIQVIPEAFPEDTTDLLQALENHLYAGTGFVEAIPTETKSLSRSLYDSMPNMNPITWLYGTKVDEPLVEEPLLEDGTVDYSVYSIKPSHL